MAGFEVAEDRWRVDVREGLEVFERTLSSSDLCRSSLFDISTTSLVIALIYTGIYTSWLTPELEPVPQMV